ncbi:MAG: lysophospholipid acyltransferase family protein [Acetobacteraceae bacterium]
MLKHLAKAAATQRLLEWLVFLYIRTAYATLRWRLEGIEHLHPHIGGEPVIAAFWHERQALMPMLWLLARRQGTRAKMHVLISGHRDGRFVAAVMERFGVQNVIGSTSRGGVAGLRNLCSLLAAGDYVAITPDGPRGPRRVAAPGVAQIAALAGVRVLPCAAQSSHRIYLSTWDRMVMPLPFGRAVIVCEPTIAVSRDGWKLALPEIAAAMTRAAERADRECAA